MDAKKELWDQVLEKVWHIGYLWRKADTKAAEADFRAVAWSVGEIEAEAKKLKEVLGNVR